MNGDEILCLNCGKTFKDITKRTDELSKTGKEYQWQGQDSRQGDFKNMCPFCYSTNTKNSVKPTKESMERYKRPRKKKGLNRNIDIVSNEEKKMKYHRCGKCKTFHNGRRCPKCNGSKYSLIHCWYCGTTGINLLDEFGCCKKCKTNLVLYSTRDKHEYPRELLSNEKLDEETLGHREKFVIPDDNDQGDY